MPGGHAPRALAIDPSTTLIISNVPAAIYNADAVEARLGDLDWVSAAGAAHHAVIDAIAETGIGVLPFRLFTLFSTEHTALEHIRARRDAMQRAFARVHGKQEWVLKIGKPDPARISAPPPAGARQASSGTSFLQAKADAKREAAARAIRVKEDAAAAFEALEQLADEAHTKSVDPAGNLLLDASFLVPPDRIEAMHETLTRRAERLLLDGCPVSLTGPWPPYSFAGLGSKND